MPVRSPVAANEHMSVVVWWWIVVAALAHACNPWFGMGVGGMDRANRAGRCLHLTADRRRLNSKSVLAAADLHPGARFRVVSPVVV